MGGNISSLPRPRFFVRLTPRGGSDVVEGWARDGHGHPYLKVRVAAPPVDAAANVALEKLIAKTLKLPRTAVRIIGGDRTRLKHLEIEGVNESDIYRILGTPD